MKRLFVLFGQFILIVALSGCSSQPVLELTSSSSMITDDKNITGTVAITEGEKKGQELVPTALYYQFSIKNTGKKKIGDIGDKGLALKIEPNDKLKAASEDIIGFNIFDSDSYINTGLGYGQTTHSMLKAGEEEDYILTYDLGVGEESPNATLLTPSEEQLKVLGEKALDAILIVLCDNKEIARFDLNHK
jgi:hypothetical protein